MAHRFVFSMILHNTKTGESFNMGEAIADAETEEEARAIAVAQWSVRIGTKVAEVHEEQQPVNWAMIEKLAATREQPR